MIIADLRVELHGNKEVTINGMNVQANQCLHVMEEQIFRKQLTLDQQWLVLCEARKLLAKMEDAYRTNPLRKQVTPLGTTISVPDGIAGTKIGQLGGKSGK